MTLRSALEHVRRLPGRDQYTKPNYGFFRQLLRYEQQLVAKSRAGSDDGGAGDLEHDFLSFSDYASVTGGPLL
jgi:hypothetical protein